MPRFHPSQRFMDYRRERHPDFGDRIRNEEQFKVEVALPYMTSLGYSVDELEFERTIDVQIGTKTHTVRADIVAVSDNRPYLVVDTKSPSERITETDVLQAVSYAKLISTPPATFGVAINGYECSGANITTGARLNDIPARHEALAAFKRRQLKPLSDIILQETRRVLNTIDNKEELYRLIRECKQLIERQGGIRNDISFKEMTKLLLVKMAEERRAQSEQQNRFDLSWLYAFSRANEISLVDTMKTLFTDACSEYHDVYQEPETIKVRSDHVIHGIVGRLENFSFTGTGDDIKGAVYEIFLKSQLRGELDQYFTPREIVEYMTTLADPEPGEITLDAACGSGGFLISVFRHVKQKIDTRNIRSSEKSAQLSRLVRNCLWGVEIDPDLHTLAKINLIMHGDGYNHIICGDGLATSALKEGSFDVVLMNPPFTTPYEDKGTLDLFDLGQGRNSQELDILFVERAVRCLRPGGRLFIVLPEGMLNLPSYSEFRLWLSEQCDLTHTTSLPEGAFQPFGNSASKTCILGVRKKSPPETLKQPVFAARARTIGYEPGKRDYRRTDGNDLVRFVDVTDGIETHVGDPQSEFVAAFVSNPRVAGKRYDAGAYLNAFELNNLDVFKEFRFVELKKLASIRDLVLAPLREILYFQADWIAPETGTIQKTVRTVRTGRHNRLSGSDIFVVSINPKLNRAVLMPSGIDEAWTTNEGHAISLLPKSEIVDPGYLVAALRMPYVVRQMTRLATGSSSSRARIGKDDVERLRIPVVSNDIQMRLGSAVAAAADASWSASLRLQESINDANRVLNPKPPCALKRRKPCEHRS